MRLHHPMRAWCCSMLMACCFGAGESICLSDGIVEDSRKAVVDGKAVQLATYTWESSRITSSIARIIMEERMGLQVNASVVLGGSHLGPPALAGGPACTADDNFATCDVNAPLAHFVMDAWGGGEKSYNLMDSTIQPILGPMGYMGREGTFVPDSAIQKGLSLSPRAFLDFYKSYNSVDANLTEFVASRLVVQAKIEELNLLKAKCTPEHIPQAHQGCSYYEEATGDYGMYTWTDGACHIVCEDDWMLSPACRAKPDECVAWVSTGDGWGVEEMLQQAAFWNISLAIVVLPDWGHYTALPFQVPSLWFWFFPDPSFMALDPVKLQEPPTDQGERAARIYRTGADAIVLHKFQWRLLPTFAPQVYGFIDNVEFSRTDIVDLMRSASQGKALDDIACNWVRQNEDRWATWLPQADLCAAGWAFDAEEARCTRCLQGTFSTGPGSTNTSCQLCSAGHFSDALGASSCMSCPAGSFSDFRGQTACTPCPSGTFGEATGMSECQPCSTGHDADLWTTMRSLETKGTSKWVPIDGATSAISCGCDVGARWKNDANGTECIPCETEGMECVGMGDVLIEEGYMSDVPVSVFKCFGDYRRCSGGSPGRTCKPGRMGLSCSECLAGKTPGSDGACKECSQLDSLPSFIAGLLAFAFLVMVYLLVNRRVGATSSPSQVFLMMSIAIGQLISVIQQLSVVAFFAVSYEEPVDSFVKFFTIFAFNVEMVRVGCVGSVSAVGRYILKVCILFSAVLTIFLCHAFTTLLAYKGRFKERRPVLVATVGVITMGLFTSIVVAVLGPLQCNKHPNGVYTMRGYEDIVCWDFGSHPEQINMLLLSGVAINGPLLFYIHVCYLVHIFPHRMKRLDATFMKSFGTIFLRFRAGAHWYIIVLITRAFLIALIPVIRDAVSQIFILQGVLLVSQSLCFIFKPWRVDKMNYLDAFFTVGMLFFSNLASFSVENVDTQAVGYLVVIMMCLAILTVPLLLIFLAYKKFGPTSKQYQYFLCHAKAETGCFCRLLKIELTENPKVKREVFLDADNLDDLDKLLSYVGHDLDTLLVLLSKSTLYRAWCAGEITVATQKRVTMVPIQFPGFQQLDTAQVKTFTQDCPNLDMLTATGLQPDAIAMAICGVNGAEALHTPEVPHAKLAATLAEDVVAGKRSGQILIATDANVFEEDPNIGIIADHTSIESLASASIIRKLVSPRVMHEERSRCMAILSEEAELPPTVHMVILVGSNGCLQSPAVLAALFEAAERCLKVLPVVCEDQFAFPTATTFHSVNEGKLVSTMSSRASRQTASGDVGRDEVAVLVQDVFKEIAVTMRTRSSPMTMLEVAATEVAARILADRVHAVKPTGTLSTKAPSSFFEQQTMRALSEAQDKMCELKPLEGDFGSYGWTLDLS